MLNARYPLDEELERFLSSARYSRYQQAVQGHPGVTAASLYDWNAHIAHKLMLPLQYAEISVRNAANEALIAEYGDAWVDSARFIRSLPDPSCAYSPRRDLQGVKNSLGSRTSVGKVVAELKLAFWEKLFTQRHDRSLWDSHLVAVFQHAPYRGRNVAVTRNEVRQKIERVRRIRNRIAHSEPIYHYDIENDLSAAMDLIYWRSPDVHSWVQGMEEVTILLSKRPI